MLSSGHDMAITHMNYHSSCVFVHKTCTRSRQLKIPTLSREGNPQRLGLFLWFRHMALGRFSMLQRMTPGLCTLIKLNGLKINAYVNKICKEEHEVRRYMG